ncbi:MAG: hypothetical protein HS115_15010 [Spirochaetales bacterium]|nr:hypothetical protein [Spirochaetales bacterium]
MKLPERITFLGTEDPAARLIDIYLGYGIQIVVGGGSFPESIQNTIRGMEPQENLLFTDPGAASAGASIVFVCLPPHETPAALAGLSGDTLAILCGRTVPPLAELRAATTACLARAFQHLPAELLENPLSYGLRISQLYCCDRPFGRPRLEQLLELCAFDPVFVGTLDRAGLLENLQELLENLQTEQGPLALKLIRHPAAPAES